MQVLKINKRDTVLTLSSGGCNSLNLLLHGAGHVVSVDCNPAQSALLELKAAAIRSVHLHQSPPNKNTHQCAALCHCISHGLMVICLAWHAMVLVVFTSSLLLAGVGNSRACWYTDCQHAYHHSHINQQQATSKSLHSLLHELLVNVCCWKTWARACTH